MMYIVSQFMVDPHHPHMTVVLCIILYLCVPLVVLYSHDRMKNERFWEYLGVASTGDK